MRKKFKKVISHPLISGSIIIFIGGLLSNFINFLFNLFMTRSLSVVDYGTFASLISLISLFLVIISSPQPMIINFAASYFAKNDIGKLKGLYFKFNKFYTVTGVCIFFILLLFPQQIAIFFNIHDMKLILLIAVFILITYATAINGPFLQAKLAFTFISLNNLLTSILKLLLGIGFIYAGLGIFGATLAFVLSLLIPFPLGYIPLLFLFKNKVVTPKSNVKELLAYGIPSAITMLGLTSFTTMDIILVKHFFNPTSAGLYAGLSLVARVIFFFSAPIASVMFPLITQKYAKKENSNNTFLLSVLMILIPSVLFNIFYSIFPDIAVNFFLKKKEYLQISNLVGLFGIYITAYSLLTIFVNFYLSIKQTKICIPVLIGLVVQISLIWLFHNTFLEIILISLTIVMILLLGLTTHYIKYLYNSKVVLKQ